MILDDQQLSAAKEHLSQMSSLIEERETREKISSNPLRKVQISAFRGFAAEAKKEILEYESLRQGKYALPEIVDLANLPKLLVQTRIFLGWSQEHLAQQTNTPLEELRRYETNCYLGASLSKKMEVAKVLDIDTTACFQIQTENETHIPEITDLHSIDDIGWSNFPIREAFNRGWIPDHTESNRTEAFKNWMSDCTRGIIASALHRKGQSVKRTPDGPSILTWQARILDLASVVIEESNIPKFTGDDRWFKNLVTLSVQPDGPSRVRDLLLEQGIVFVVERHLPKTYLDGAALLSHDGHPIVALTLRYNRLDYFWFTLFHELAHVYLHLFSRHHSNFFDSKILTRKNQESPTGKQARDQVEDEADRFALKKLITAEEWDRCQSRQYPIIQNVIADAIRLNIHPGIIAGRIRKEQNNFTILGTLLGQGSLHQHFVGDCD